PASPAFAHDTLKRSSPAKNAEVSSVEEIELEYSASVKFPFVVLHDATGEEVALGEPGSTGRWCPPRCRSRSRPART
ncbi:copper resistance CopC family protein, partial [Nonomuraea rubra]|uniref:copper resistance CopC family protein n=1 Tax=Nonomuraea rubra TaxID=46180 RepID=UPI0031EDA3F8